MLEVKTWAEIKLFADLGFPTRVLQSDTQYRIFTNDILYVMDKDPTDTSDLEDFETNYKHNCNKNIINEVTTQAEKDDKSLVCVAIFSKTDAQGVARVAIKMPADGRFIAFGDGEFETREWGDHISKLEVSDLDREIAWYIALQLNPEATAPLTDEDVRQIEPSLPAYPVIGFFDEREMNSEATNKCGTIVGGMTMTFRYGNTEVRPVGGYAWIVGGAYLIVEAKNALEQKAADIGFQANLAYGRLATQEGIEHCISVAAMR